MSNISTGSIHGRIDNNKRDISVNVEGSSVLTKKIIEKLDTKVAGLYYQSVATEELDKGWYLVNEPDYPLHGEILAGPFDLGAGSIKGVRLSTDTHKCAVDLDGTSIIPVVNDFTGVTDLDKKVLSAQIGSNLNTAITTETSTRASEISRLEAVIAATKEELQEAIDEEAATREEVDATKMAIADYDANETVKNAGGIIPYVDVYGGKIDHIYVNTEEQTITNKTVTLTTIDNVTSAGDLHPLTANQGKVLNDRIDSLVGIGRFLSLWNCVTGKPATEPTTLPYKYRTGDYYRISEVNRGAGAVNYMPNGSQYTGEASTTPYEGTDTLYTNDLWFYDGTTWSLLKNRVGGFVEEVLDVNGQTIVSSGTARLSKAAVGLGNVDNKSEATIKSDFTGTIAEGDTGFTLGGHVYSAITPISADVTELKTKGHYISKWNCVTGLPESSVTPMTYKPGDYFKVEESWQDTYKHSLHHYFTEGSFWDAVVYNNSSATLPYVEFGNLLKYVGRIPATGTWSTTGTVYCVEDYSAWTTAAYAWMLRYRLPDGSERSVLPVMTYEDTVTTGSNYKPDGNSYSGVASTTVDNNKPMPGDLYLYDGTQWCLLRDNLSVYVKPQAGIQKGDLSLSLQSSINKADTAIQSLGDLSITATSTELNYSTGLTSNVQTQLNDKLSMNPFDNEWTQLTWPTGVGKWTIGDAAYGNGAYVAVQGGTYYTGGSSEYLYSTDGINWQYKQILIDGTATSTGARVVFWKNKFWTLRSDNTAPYVLNSEDGLNWTKINYTNTGSNCNAIVCSKDIMLFMPQCNGKFNGSYVYKTTNGVEFVKFNLPASSYYWQAAFYGKDKFIITSIDTRNYCAYSADGETWTLTTTPSNVGQMCGCYINNRYVMFPCSLYIGDYLTSSDGITWTRETWTPSLRNFYNAKSNGNILVAAGNDDSFVYSADGINWTQGKIGTITRNIPTIYGIVFDDSNLTCFDYVWTTGGVYANIYRANASGSIRKGSTNVSSATANILKPYLSGEIALGNSGFTKGGDVHNALSTKQNTLVSGTNIKTINSQSIVGPGNILVDGGGNDVSVEGEYIVVTPGTTVPLEANPSGTATAKLIDVLIGDTIYNIIPAAPTVNGTYKLTCTVTDGVVSYNWVNN